MGASTLSQFDFFSLPMIELCDIFSLDSPLPLNNKFFW